jgi:PilZ domain
MEERRNLQRFYIQAPTRIETASEGKSNRVLNLVTRDLSSSGAFVSTEQPLREGAPVRLEVLLSLAMLPEITGGGARARVRVRGKVIRVDEGGMAILFSGRHRFVSRNGRNDR